MSNLSKVGDARSWRVWRESGAVGGMKEAYGLRFIAISSADMQSFGCPYCGYRSGFSTIKLLNASTWECGDCEGRCVILGDCITHSTIGIYTPHGYIYPKVRKHPRQGIPKHGREDKRPQFGEYFNSRGIGSNVGICFVCETDDRQQMLNNIAAFVRCKDAGERVVAMFKRGAHLDYREFEPDRVQVKICACDLHLPNLERLNDFVKDGVILQEHITEALSLG